MLYHCGLLDDRPYNSRTLKWIKSTSWTSLPPEIEHELHVWLAMPGFVLSYHQHVLGVSRDRLMKHTWDYDVVRDDVAANWLSATRDDCVKLSQLRKGKGDVPLISQIRALEDLKHMRLCDVARDYRVTPQNVLIWKRTGFKFDGQLPRGFEFLVQK